MIDQGSGDGWDQHAEWWQQEFTDGVDPEYTEQILPIISRQLAGRATIVDIGTGEGQVARQLRADGAALVGVDPVASQVALAAERGGGAHYVRAGAAALPLADASFEGAVACLVFEHIDDLDLSAWRRPHEFNVWVRHDGAP